MTLPIVVRLLLAVVSVVVTIAVAAFCYAVFRLLNSGVQWALIAVGILAWRLSPATKRPALPVNGKRNEG